MDGSVDNPPSFRFRVDGTPATEGNLRRSPSGGLYHANGPALSVWRQAIGWAARSCHRGAAWPSAVALELTFVLHRPQRPKASVPIVRPDWDKLARAVCDALTGVVYVDDSQVVEASVVKRYAVGPELPGVEVGVWLLEDS